MKLVFRAFKANLNKELCERFLEGHREVLLSYGIANITTNTNDWMNYDCVYCVIAQNEEGKVVGGIRIQLADGVNQLPVERAIGKMDPTIHEVVRKYTPEGVGELCALWNSKDVAGMGLSIILTRAGISVVNQLKCNTLMGICAEYTLKMFTKVGFVVDNNLGHNGLFVYPNENYLARVLGILNAGDLATAEEFDRLKMLDLRKEPIQDCVEINEKGKPIEIKYLLLF